MDTPTQDYKFVSELPASMKCVICSRAARNPKQHEECGKLFCKACLDNYGSDSCPSCKKKGSQYFNDRKSKLQIICLYLVIAVHLTRTFVTFTRLSYSGFNNEAR